jgi:flagellar hook assembly protein FlgD
VFDASGRIVRTLARGAFDSGAHEIEWNGLDETGHAAAPGRYFVRLRAGRLEKTIDLVRLR